MTFFIEILMRLKKVKLILLDLLYLVYHFAFSNFKGYDYFVRSFLISEDSKETGGLQNIYILKFFIFFMGILLSIELIHRIFDFFKKND